MIWSSGLYLLEKRYSLFLWAIFIPAIIFHTQPRKYCQMDSFPEWDSKLIFVFLLINGTWWKPDPSQSLRQETDQEHCPSFPPSCSEAPLVKMCFVKLKNIFWLFIWKKEQIWNSDHNIHYFFPQQTNLLSIAQSTVEHMTPRCLKPKSKVVALSSTIFCYCKKVLQWWCSAWWPLITHAIKYLKWL